MARIGLLDVDGHNFPNLPLMKLSAYHKARGDHAELCVPLDRYDRVYAARVFTASCFEVIPNADEIIRGGTGYGLDNCLPDEIEHIYPDYGLYDISDTAYGFLSRGCPRRCGFCIVSQKEGRTSKHMADLGEFWRGQRYIKLLDPNLLACRDREVLLRRLAESRAWVDFTQGLDIRLANGVIPLLNRVKTKMIHFAWDNPREDLSGHFHRFKRLSGIKDYRKLGVYVLTNFGSTPDEDLHRVYTLRDLGYSPYVMIYDKQNAPRETRLLQRWVNNRIIFASVRDFSDFDASMG